MKMKRNAMMRITLYISLFFIYNKPPIIEIIIPNNIPKFRKSILLWLILYISSNISSLTQTHFSN